MSRLTLALAAWLSFASVSSASLTPRKEPRRFANEAPPAPASQLPAQALEQATGAETQSEFIVTEGTEILLNGKPCKYADVPASASIVRMEVAADKKTLLKIHFRTWK
jgi:hypothetical protein